MVGKVCKVQYTQNMRLNTNEKFKIDRQNRSDIPTINNIIII